MKNVRIMLFLLIFILSMTTGAMAQEDFMSRMDFTKEVLTIGNIEIKEDAISSFGDVTDPQDIPYVEAAYSNKIITGWDGTFKPQNSITKEEAITIVVRALGEERKAKEISPETANKIISYEDSSLISQWARPYVAYGLSNGILEKNDGLLDPKGKLTMDDGKIIIENAKKIYDSVLTREGLTAAQMLDLVSTKFEDFSTYKFKTSMETTSEVTISSKEQENQGSTETVNMTIQQEGVFEKPLKIYIKSNTLLSNMKEQPSIQSEVIMDDKTMYMKADGSEKWMKFDMNPIMEESQKLLGNSNTSNGGLTKEQMELFGMYASFDEDMNIDGTDYYMVDVQVDSDSFMKIYKEIMEKTMDFYANMGSALSEKDTESSGEINKEEIRNQIQQMLEKLKIEVSYKFYINKETKIYEDMDMTQTIHMNMGEADMKTHSEAKYKYYDFNKDVTIPTINPEDVETIEQ